MLVKDYMRIKNISEIRMMFRIRTKMLNLKDNARGQFRANLDCRACDTREIESQTHVLSCSGYADIRVGLDMNIGKDLIAYFSQVKKISMEE
jgi:hypothetical protein